MSEPISSPALTPYEEQLALIWIRSNFEAYLAANPGIVPRDTVSEFSNLVEASGYVLDELRRSSVI